MIAARFLADTTRHHSCCVGTLSRRTRCWRVLVALGDRMSSLGTRSILAHAGLYSAAVLFIAVATSASAPPSSPVAVHQQQSVDRFHKGDRLARPKTFRDADSPIVVEVSGKSDVVVRDREGNILFAVDNATRATTIAKQPGRSAAPHFKVTPPAELDLPAGCEGIFSPYAEPSKARIIGRCMSAVHSQPEMVS
jgi:hypothetical protein